jgi:hypothetical protein
VDGPLTVRFGLSCIKQRLLEPSLLRKLEQHLQTLAVKERKGRSSPVQDIKVKQVELSQISNQIEVVRGNLAFAKSREQYEAVSEVFDQLEQRRECLEAEIGNQKGLKNLQIDMKAELDSAMVW